MKENLDDRMGRNRQKFQRAIIYSTGGYVSDLKSERLLCKIVRPLTLEAFKEILGSYRFWWLFKTFMHLRFHTPVQSNHQFLTDRSSGVLALLSVSVTLSVSQAGDCQLTDTWPLMMTSSEKRTLTGLDFNLAFFAALINADLGD